MYSFSFQTEIKQWTIAKWKENNSWISNNFTNENLERLAFLCSLILF